MIRFYAMFSSAILVGFIAYFMESKFTTISRNWSSLWMWGSFAFLWLMFSGSLLKGFLQHEAARYLERETRKSRDAR